MHDTSPAAPRLFTARFGAQREIVASGAVPVRISIGFPRFRLSYQLTEKVPELMPTRAMLKMAIEPYRELYLARLEEVGTEKLRAIFAAIAERHPGATGLVLLCFEDIRKPGEWCHRTMAGLWLQEHGFGAFQELEAVPAPAAAGQTSLV